MYVEIAIWRKNDFLIFLTCILIEFNVYVQVEDVIFLARKQPKMYARTRDLLTMNEELKKARKAFDEVKYVQDQK